MTWRVNVAHGPTFEQAMLEFCYKVQGGKEACCAPHLPIQRVPSADFVLCGKCWRLVSWVDVIVRDIKVAQRRRRSRRRHARSVGDFCSRRIAILKAKFQ